MLNTHEQIKELQKSDLSEKQAEGIVEFIDRNNKALMQVFNNRFDTLDGRFERLEAILERRFDAIDKRFDAIDKKFESVDRKFEFLETKMDSHRGQIMTWIGVGIAFASVMVAISTVYGK